MKKAAFYICIAVFLICVPLLIFAFHLHLPERWTDETIVQTVLAVVLFGLIPDGIPAVLLAVLLASKRVTDGASLLGSKPALLALAGALVAVYGLHWWTFSEQVESGLLVHAAAVPFFGVIAILLGFGAGSILQTQRRP